MAALGDYLGALLSEVTNARLQADLESARIAELYAAHPLLRHMSIPRFRLPNVILNLPVAVERVEQPTDTQKSALATELPALRQRLGAVIDQELNQRGLLTPSLRKSLTSKLDASFKGLKDPDVASAASAIKTSDKLVTATMEVIRSASRQSVAPDPMLESSLRNRFSAEFLTLPGPLPQVEVLAVTAQIKDIAPPQTLTRIQLTISEEGVEWTQTNPDDSSTRTLVPE